MPSFPLRVGERDVTIEFADAVYPIAAVHGTAVVFIDKAFILIERAAAGRTRVALRPKQGGATADELKELGGSVLNELLHQALRIEVGAKTDKLRELVIGKGIMAAEAAPGMLGDGLGLGMGDGSVAFSDDPLGIARPWEETYLGQAARPSAEAAAGPTTEPAPDQGDGK